MKTTVTIQTEVVRELMEHYGARTKTAAVNVALGEQLRLIRLQQLADLLGRVDLDEGALEDAAVADGRRGEWLEASEEHDDRR
jgi:hypothetical protein